MSDERLDVRARDHLGLRAEARFELLVVDPGVARGEDQDGTVGKKQRDRLGDVLGSAVKLLGGKLHRGGGRFESADAVRKTVALEVSAGGFVAHGRESSGMSSRQFAASRASSPRAEPALGLVGRQCFARFWPARRSSNRRRDRASSGSDASAAAMTRSAQSRGIPKRASATLPAKAAVVSASPPRSTARSTASSKEPEAHTQASACGTQPRQVSSGRGPSEAYSAQVRFTGVVTFSDLENSGNTVINGDNITTGTIRAVDYVAVGQIGDNDYSVFAVEDGADNRIGYIGYQFIQGDGDYADKLWIRTEEFGDWKPCIKIEAAGRVSLESTDISDGLIYIRSANAITLSADHLVQIEVNGTEWTFEDDGIYMNGTKVV